MVITDNNTITIVRGDTASIEVSVNAIVNGEEQEYELEEGDVLTFRMSKVFQGEPLIEKTVDDGMIGLVSSDTESLPFGSYFYDVTLESDGAVDHIIQADKNSPNFIIVEAVPYGSN